MPNFSFSEWINVFQFVVLLGAFLWKREAKNDVNQANQDRLATDLTKLNENINSLQVSVQQLAVQVAKQQVILDYAILPNVKAKHGTAI